MLPTSTHLTPVIGLDLHLATSGNPFHPYVGMVIDPFDYIPFLGSNVNINGLKRGVSDTSGVLITFRHIPLVGAFIMMPIIGHESMNFFSSQTVFAEGTRLSPKGYMVMTCNDVGIPFSGALSKVGKKKFKFTPTLFAPTSFSIPIPTGAPVMVGGPYAPDWGGMLTGLLSSIGFSTLLSFAPAILKAMKKVGKKGGNLSKAYANKARKLMSGVADNTPLPRRKKNKLGFNPTTATKKQKGNFGEICSCENLTNNPDLKKKGYNLKRIGDPAPTSINDSIKHGIDGIYENTTPPPSYVIDEAKYGTSQLGSTKSGKQMSDSWVNDRLESQVGEDKAREIQKAMSKGNVDKVISRIDEKGNVITNKLNSAGEIISSWP